MILSTKELKIKEELYLKAKYQYYIIGNSIMLDSTFDKLEEELKENNSKVVELVDFPSTIELKNMGYDISNIIDTQEKDETKYNHLTPYLSLEKIQINDEKNIPYDSIKLFLDRLLNIKQWEVSLKYDGNAQEIIYIDGKLHQALTRGDKLYGFDKTNKLKYLVPNEIPIKGKVQIRGELVLNKDLFINKYFDEKKTDTGQNARNTVAGIINRDDYNVNELQDLIYVAYDLVKIDDNNNSYNVENTMETLYDIGFNQKYKPEILYLNNISEFDDLYFKMKKLKEDSQFLIDGFVIKFEERYRNILGSTNHHSKSVIAIKFKSEETETEILDIEWSLGKNRELTPVALLKKTMLLGTLVGRASLSNIGVIISNKYFPGAKVRLKKSGEIIPMIIALVEHSPLENEYMKQFNDFLNY
jgi:DNA ligase (NAD+)